MPNSVFSGSLPGLERHYYGVVCEATAAAARQRTTQSRRPVLQSTPTRTSSQACRQGCYERSCPDPFADLSANKRYLWQPSVPAGLIFRWIPWKAPDGRSGQKPRMEIGTRSALGWKRDEGSAPGCRSSQGPTVRSGRTPPAQVISSV